MNYIDADKIYRELERLEQMFPVENGTNLPADYVITYLKKYIKQVERVVIPNDEIFRKAERDLFHSHESAAVQEAEKRFVTNYHPECCLLVNAYDIVTRLKTAFVEGVIWKENEEIKEEKL